MIVAENSVIFGIPVIGKSSSGMGDKAVIDVVKKIIKPGARCIRPSDNEFFSVLAEVSVLHRVG